MNDLDINMAICGIFLNATLRTAVRLGHDYEVNSRYVKNNLWNSIGQLFRETGKLISDQNEITGIRTIDFQDATWMQTSILREKACRFTALCGKSERWPYCNLEEAKLNGVRETVTSRIWIESTVCRRSSSGKYSQESSRRFKVQWEETYSVNLSTSMTGSSSCQCTTTLFEENKKYRNMWIQFTDSCELCSQIPSRSLVSLGAWIRKEMVLNLQWQTRRILGPNCREHDVEFLIIWSSNISCLQCLWERRIKKQRTWPEVFSLQR